MDSKKTAKGLWKSGVSFVGDWLIEHWPTLLAVLGGTAMTRLAQLSALLAPYGAVAWGGVGIASFLLLSVAFWAMSARRRNVAMSVFAEKRAESTGINPLDDHFTKRRILLSDFFNPFYHATKGAKFQDCELIGPALVSIQNCNLDGNQFQDCEVVLVDGAPVKGAMQFDGCMFARCKFLRVTLLMPPLAYDQMASLSTGAQLPIVSAGGRNVQPRLK